MLRLHHESVLLPNSCIPFKFCFSFLRRLLPAVCFAACILVFWPGLLLCASLAGWKPCVGSCAPHCPFPLRAAALFFCQFFPDFIPSTCAPLKELLHFCTQHFVTSHGVCVREGCHFLWPDSSHGSDKLKYL